MVGSLNIVRGSVVALLAAVFTIGCDRPATPPPVVEDVSVTHVTSADVPTTKDGHGYIEAVRREQRELDAQLDEALAAIDRRLGTRPAERAALLEQRSRLAADQRLVAKSDERGWDELKAEIERDLRVTGTD